MSTPQENEAVNPSRPPAEGGREQVDGDTTPEVNLSAGDPEAPASGLVGETEDVPEPNEPA